MVDTALELIYLHKNVLIFEKILERKENALIKGLNVKSEFKQRKFYVSI